MALLVLLLLGLAAILAPVVPEVYGSPGTVTNPPSANTPGSWTDPAYAYADDLDRAYSTANNQWHRYSGYGFNIDSEASITRVRVRLDAYSNPLRPQDPEQIKLEVSSNGGVSWLPTTYTTTTITTTEQTIWVPVSSWDSWTPSKINNNQIQTRVTHVGMGLIENVYLDFIPIEVTYSLISKIVFTTAAQTLTAGNPSAVMTIQTQNSSDIAVNVPYDTTISLTSDSGTGRFSLSDSSWSDITSVTITAGTNSQNFYYKDTKAGTPTITAAESPSKGWTDATQLETINPAAASKLVITVYPSSVAAGSWTTAYTVQRQDQYSNPVTSGSTDVNLASTPTGTNSKFSSSPTGTPVVTSVTISSGSSTVNFYYYDQKAGSYTISVSATGLTGDSKGLTVNPAALASFTITGCPTSVTAGQSFGSGITVLVTAYDSYDNVKTDYTGTVHFTSTDSQAVLPPDYTFVAGDNGVHPFDGSGFTLKTTPSQTITVADGAISQPSPSITVNPGGLASFTIFGYPSSTTAGVDFGSNDVVVTAYDGYHNVKTNYVGSVYFTSSDLQAILPYTSGSPYAFTTGSGQDNGVHTFPGSGFTLKTAGLQTVAVTDGTISAASSSITVNPASLDHFEVTGYPSSVTAGQSFGSGITVLVTAYDSYDNVKTDYTGTVHFTSTDSQAVLPPDYTFVAGDNGVHPFDGSGFTLKTTPSQTITVADGAISQPSPSITVNPAAASKLVITVYPSSVAAGSWTTAYTVQRQDQYSNPVTSGSTDVNLASTPTGTNSKFSSSPTGTPVVTSVTISSGSSTVNFYYYDQKAGSYTISVSATGLTGDSKGLTVNPAAASKLVITVYPSSVDAGSWTTVYTVQRQDQYGNPVTTGTDTVNLASTSIGINKWFSATSGGLPVTSVDITDGSSSADFYYYDELAGTWSISVSATGLTGDLKSLVVNPIALHHFVFNTISPQVAGIPFDIIITAKDQFGNTVIYTGTNTLSDSTGTIAPTSTGAFVSGIRIVTVTVTGAGSGVTISTNGAGRSGASNSFTIDTAALDHFDFSSISTPQAAGVSFSITITAKDAYENTVTSYTGTNALADTTTTISPTSTAAFSSGVWTGNVNIAKVQAHVTITTSGGGKTGTSNTFDVGLAKVLMKVSYTIIGGGSPSAPEFHYAQDFTDKIYTLTTIPTDISVNKDSCWYVAPNPLAGSSSSERWVSIKPTSGVAKDQTIVFTYYHQFVQTIVVPVTSTMTVGSCDLGLSATVKTFTGQPRVTLVAFPQNPQGTHSFTALNKYVQVEFSSIVGVMETEIRVCYSPASVSGLDQSAFKIYWWAAGTWQACSISNVNLVGNYAWAKITEDTTPNLSQLRNALFVGGGTQGTDTPPPTAPPPTSTPIYPTPTAPSTWSPPSVPSWRMCIIATATYGSALAPEVVYMRHVRDDMIGSNEVGRAIVSGWNTFYYSWSTPLASCIASSEALQSIFRILLLPLVAIVHLTASTYAAIASINLALASVIAFSTAAILSVASYIIAPALTLRTIYRKKHVLRSLPRCPLPI